MKWIVWCLLLINASLLAYFNLNSTQDAGALIGHQSIEPEKIKLLTPQEIQAMPKKSATAATSQPIQEVPVQYGCYEWGSFSSASLQRARNTLSRFSLDAQVKQKTSQEAVRYWVYIPRQKSLQEAQAKVEELRSHGVQESYVVQETQWRNAVSLGVFNDEKLANALLDDLKSRGVDYAVKGVRNQEKGQASLVIAQMTHDMAGEIEKLKPDFPGSELREITCP